MSNKFVPEGYKGQWNFDTEKVTLNKTQDLEEYNHTNQSWHDYHAQYTICFGELVDGNFDWGQNDYPCHSEEIRAELNSLIVESFRFREICEAPPAKFRTFLLRKLNLIMPKYNKMFEVLSADRFDILETEQTYAKKRDVFSEYPQSQIQGSADYATNANDNESKGKRTGPNVELMNEYADKYQSVYQRIIKELDVCFYSTTSGFINAY